VLDLDMSGENENPDFGEIAAYGASRLETFSRVPWRHPNVDHGQIGPVLVNEFDELRAVSGLTNHLEPGALEQAGNALPQEHIVVREDYAQSRHPHPLATVPIMS
jgi:hypothetical protein